MLLSDLYTVNKGISRKRYFWWILFLFFIKFNIIRWFVWSKFNDNNIIVSLYGFPLSWLAHFQLPHTEQQSQSFSLPLLLPFTYCGLVLSYKRLQTLRLSKLLLFIWFMPAVNFLFFLTLVFIPDTAKEKGDNTPPFLSMWIPKDKFASAVFGIAITVCLGIIFTVFSVFALKSYGIVLFICLPFLLGFASTLIYAYHEKRTLVECFSVTLSSVFLLGLLLLAFAIEGLICIVMAAPIALLCACSGALFAFFIQHSLTHNAPGKSNLCLFPLVLPFLMIGEKALNIEPELHSNTTSIYIDAAPDLVWKNVVTFSELPAPKHWLFKTGIAYPLRARIEGRGVGAIRYCEFSTGPFVEPIEIWDEPNLLRFSVIETPHPMKEWSPYANLEPAHLEGFFVSKRGQFKLTPQGNGTMLHGTTWYSNNVWPSQYWGVISDYILTTIHTRVLDFIKQESERLNNLQKNLDKTNRYITSAIQPS